MTMDFTYLVESGKYSKDDLTWEQQEYINGLEQAIEEVGYCASNVFDSDEDDPLYEQMLDSIRIEATEEIKKWIQCRIYEDIVTFADNNYCEAEQRRNGAGRRIVEIASEYESALEALDERLLEKDDADQ